MRFFLVDSPADDLGAPAVYATNSQGLPGRRQAAIRLTKGRLPGSRLCLSTVPPDRVARSAFGVLGWYSMAADWQHVWDEEFLDDNGRAHQNDADHNDGEN